MGSIKLIFVGAAIVALAAQVLAAPEPDPRRLDGCKPCLKACIQKDGELDCPNNLPCLSCYKELIDMEEATIQREKAEEEKEKNELKGLDVEANKMALKKALKKSSHAKLKKAGKVLEVKDAFERAGKKTTDVDEMVKIVKKEVGEAAFNEVGEELVKRFVCGGACITAAATVFSGWWG